MEPAVNATPLVTIITPAYNREALIAATIDSVLNQDYGNIEYIVIDDGSTDGTLAVIQRYAARLVWRTHENVGEARTVNRGFAMARGEVIGVVNSDDPLLPGAVTKIVSALLDNPAAVVAYPDWQLIDAAGEPLDVIRTYDFTKRADMIRRHHCLPGPAAFFRRSVLETLGGRDPRYRYVGDLEFWFRASLTGDFLRVGETLATFRTHQGSATVGSKGEAMAREHVAMVEDFFARDDLPPDVARVKNEALSSACYVAACTFGRRQLASKCGYLVRALRLCPWQYLTEYRSRLFGIPLVLLGLPWHRLHRLRRLLRKDSR